MTLESKVKVRVKTIKFWLNCMAVKANISYMFDVYG